MYFETSGETRIRGESKPTLSVAHADLLLVFPQGEMT